MLKFYCSIVFASLIEKRKGNSHFGMGGVGERPAVIARGGFSGLFPDSSRFAYDFVGQVSLPDSILYCDLQLTKDGVGFCQSELKLDNSTNIALLFPKGQKSYNVNGKDVRGWFAIDYLADALLPNLTCKSFTLTASLVGGNK